MKTTWVRAINKSSHLKVVGLLFLSKIKKKKKFILVKLQLVKLQPATLEIPFIIKLRQKIFKFIRISQRTEAVIVNVTLRFTLSQEKGMCSLKIHDNVLLSWVSNECQHDILYVSKIKPVNKIHAQSCNRNSIKFKKAKHQNDVNVVLVFNFI